MLENSVSNASFPALSYADVLNRFADQHAITVATGATCAYLGDERNLREFLVADEISRCLRKAGHIVSFLLINDSMDPLNSRQLRVAVNKDPALIERYEHWCGKPISQLPDPWSCHSSYAEHFEEELLQRLHRLDCHPTIISSAKLYERGMYAPYVRVVLKRYNEIVQFLNTRFPNYKPDKLFWVLCPHCRYIDQTKLLDARADRIFAHCTHCNCTSEIPHDEVQGKLNWKLDCAVRWVMLKIDIEPFSKAYLEPQAGTLVVAKALANEFFGARDVTPFPYGAMHMEKKWSYKLLDSLPAAMLREMLVVRPSTDLKISHEFILTNASRYEVSSGLPYQDFVKQILPVWLLSPDKLTPSQRELVAHGIAFSKNFLNIDVQLHLPSREQIVGEPLEVLQAVRQLIELSVSLRKQNSDDVALFEKALQKQIDDLETLKRPTLHRLRLIVGQQRGLPAVRFLFALPVEYLVMVEFMLELYLHPRLAALAEGQRANAGLKAVA